PQLGTLEALANLVVGDVEGSRFTGVRGVGGDRRDLRLAPRSDPGRRGGVVAVAIDDHPPPPPPCARASKPLCVFDVGTCVARYTSCTSGSRAPRITSHITISMPSEPASRRYSACGIAAAASGSRTSR